MIGTTVPSFLPRSVARRRFAGWAVLVLAGLPVQAQPPEEPPPPVVEAAAAAPQQEPPAETTETAEAAEAEPAAAPPAEGTIEEECSLPPSGDWLDNLQRGVYRSVCGASLWFDHFFGSKRIEHERHDTYGWLGATTSWDERDGVEPRVRLRAKFALPRISNRLNAVVGRDDREAFLGDEAREERVIPDPFSDADEEWLTGLEYRGVRGDRHDLDFGLGVDLGFPLDPYVRGRYRYQDFLGESWFVRWRLTPFWSRSEEWGASTRVELDHVLSDDLLLRIGTSALASEESQGVEWHAGPTLYHRLSDRRAMAWRLLAWGESDAPAPLEGYGGEATYRQRVWKEWLYLELELRLAARRESLEEEREWVPRVGFGFEMRFGEQER
ncbi:MAG TPA: hypothetical protein VMV46_06125 [Thermoanaerobaculia bacterium]|nr:hypothetical protein [Thermoanaerobaculia bacterium]